MKPRTAFTGKQTTDRTTLVAMAAAYCLGVFNDNYFKQAAMLLAVASGHHQLQGWAAMLFALPFILFAAHGGWCADRFPKKRVVVMAKGVELAAMLIGAAGLITGNWLCILAMVFLMGLQSTIFGPALNGAIPEIYPTEDVPRINAIMKLVTTLAILAGIATAGVCLDLTWPGTTTIPFGVLVVAAVAVLAAAVGFLASFGVTSRPAAGGVGKRAFPWLGPWNSIRDLLDIRRDRELLLAVCADAFFYLVASATVLIINAAGLEQFGFSQTKTSLLSVALMLGVCAGSFAAARLVRIESWSRYLVRSAFGIAAALSMAALADAVDGRWQFLWLACWLTVAGIAGGLFLIPVASLLQARPADSEKGRVLAASGFSSFAAILFSGLLYNGLESSLRPTACLLALGIFGFLATCGFFFFMRAGNPVRSTVAGRLLRLLLSLRYRIEMTGLEAIAERGREGILFLPNHPALIDPVIVMSALRDGFRPRPLSDARQAGKPFVRQVMRFVKPITIPAVGVNGRSGKVAVQAAMDEVVASLAAGRNILFYPAGHLNRCAREDLAGNSGVEFIVRRLPEVRTVLVRTSGLWGSSFSWASGNGPSLSGRIATYLKALICNGLFFGPKRTVTLEFVEDTTISRLAGRSEINRYLERFYNERVPANTHLPYYWWQGRRPQPRPEPHSKTVTAETDSLPDSLKTEVMNRLAKMSGVAVEPSQRLAGDLALDSLTILEMSGWLESEFGVNIPDAAALVTVEDCILAAAGRLLRHSDEVPAPAGHWFAAEGARLELAAEERLTDAFLRQAARHPRKSILADRTAGCKTYRDIVTAIFALLPTVRKIPGERVGIMLPASVAGAVSYLAVLFSGKTPVLFNWTAGITNMAHGIQETGVGCIISARPLCARVEEQQDIRLQDLPVAWLYLDELLGGLHFGDKLLALTKAIFCRKTLARRPVSATAAILFTSGSEARPKAVPLSHANILANLQDFCLLLELRDDARLLGMLPPFHSLGLVGTIIMPLCLGLPTVYHPNPTEPAILTRIIDSFQVSMLIATPTFFQGILQAGDAKQLRSLRSIFTGAEKCPEQLRQDLARINPHAELCEGYGITECSPLVSINIPGGARAGTIGRVLPSIDYVVAGDDLSRRAAAGEQGLLLVRGPSIFQGYLNSPADQGFCTFEGKTWYQTGDYVREEPDGHLVFRGRKKRFIKIGGEMISLPAIEAALLTAVGFRPEAGPALAVEATACDSHPEIVLFTTKNLQREEVNRQLKEAGLSALHNIRRLIQIKDIPVLGSGKTDYAGLRQLLAG